MYITAGGVVTAALLQRGEFGAEESILVWLVLAGSSLALLATTASRLLQNALYALGDARRRRSSLRPGCCSPPASGSS